MSRLNSHKRNKLALLALATTVTISLYWALVIRNQQESLVNRRADLAGLRQKIHVGKINAARLEQYKLDLEAAQRRLLAQENDMPSGDVYRWLVRSFLNQQTNDAVEVLDLSPPRIGESSLLPRAAYPEAVFTLTGKAHYHDFGLFLADLENRFAHMRVRKMDLEPAHVGDPASPDAEKVFFNLEISALVNTNEFRRAIELTPPPDTSAAEKIIK